MRWIRRRRGASENTDTSQAPEAPKRPVGAWREVDPAAMRVSAEPPTAGSTQFVRALPTRWQQAPILGPLGHDVTLDGPSGLMPDVARTVDPVRGERPEFVWPSVRKPRVAGARRARAVGQSAAVSRSAWPTPLRRAAVVAGDIEGPVSKPRVSVVEDGGATQAAPTSFSEPEEGPDVEDSSEADTAAVVDETPVEVPPALPITNPKPISTPEVRGRARRTRLGPPIEPASPDVRDVMSDPETEVSERGTSKQVPQSLPATTTYSPESTIDELEAAPGVSAPSPTMSLRQVPVVRAAERKAEPRPDDSVLETEHDAPSIPEPAAPTATRPADIAPIVSGRRLFAPLQSISVAGPPSQSDQSTPVSSANQSSAFAQVFAPLASPVPPQDLGVTMPPHRTLGTASTRFVPPDGPSAPQQIPSIPSAVPASPALPQTALSASPRPALSASPALPQTALPASSGLPRTALSASPAPLQSVLHASTQPVSSASLRSGLPASPALLQPAASSASPRPATSSASPRPGLPASPAPSQPALSVSPRLDLPALPASPQSSVPALAQTVSPAPLQSAAPTSPAPTQPASLPAPSPPTPAASGDPFALDQLAADLYDRLRSRLVDELYVGRERAQLLTDL